MIEDIKRLQESLGMSSQWPNKSYFEQHNKHCCHWIIIHKIKYSRLHTVVNDQESELMENKGMFFLRVIQINRCRKNDGHRKSLFGKYYGNNYCRKE